MLWTGLNYGLTSGTTTQDFGLWKQKMLGCDRSRVYSLQSLHWSNHRLMQMHYYDGAKEVLRLT